MTINSDLPQMQVVTLFLGLLSAIVFLPAYVAANPTIKSAMGLYDRNGSLDSWDINLDLLSFNQKEIKR